MKFLIVYFLANSFVIAANKNISTEQSKEYISICLKGFEKSSNPYKNYEYLKKIKDCSDKLDEATKNGEKNNQAEMQRR